MSDADVIEVVGRNGDHADPSRRLRRRFRWARDAGASRRGQQAVVAAVVALLVAFASLLVLMTVSIARTMVDQDVQSLGPLGRTVEVRAVGQQGKVIPAARLKPMLGSHWDGLAAPAVSQFRTMVSATRKPGHEITLFSRSGACSHLRFTDGRCPTGRAEISVSTESAKVLKLSLHDTIQVGDKPLSQNHDPTRRTMRVVGIFDQSQQDSYWRGLDIEDVPKQVKDLSSIRRHTWLTSDDAFGGDPPKEREYRATSGPGGRDSPDRQGWGRVETSMARQLTPGAFGYDHLDEANDAVTRTGRLLNADSALDADLTEQVSTVDENVRGNLDQIRVIAPLLLAQLVLLQAVLLWIVLRALLTGRRHEVAMLRLRSPGRRGARRLLMGELTPAVLVGLPGGLALAYGLDWLFRTTWLGGTHGGWSWLSLGVAALTTLACLALLLALVRGVVRAPVSSLLRTVPPRQHRWALSPVQAVVLTLAIGMLITVATGTLTGAPVLVTPLVIALAAGLLIGGLLIPVGNRVATGLLRKGKVPRLLALTGLARRASTRNLVLAMTAAGALLAFTTSTMTLGMENRENSAGITVGAAERLDAIDTQGIKNPEDAVKAVDRIDPKHEHLTTVIRVRSGSSDGPVTLAGRPSAMSRIALRAGQPDPWAKLTSSAASGALPAVTATWSPPTAESQFSAPSLTSVDADYAKTGAVEVIPGADENTFITPLGPLLAQADRFDNFTAEVWSDGTDPRGLARAQAALQKLGFDSVTKHSVTEERDRLDTSASAYGLQLGLLVAAGSVLIAALVLIAVLSSQARARNHDFSGLARAGVPATALRRARHLDVGLSVLPLLLGGMVGWMGAWLAAPHVPWFTEPPPYPISGALPPVLPALAAVLAGLVVVGATALVAGRTRRPV